MPAVAMSAIEAARRAWDRFWFGPFDPRVARRFRIALGALLLSVFALYLPSWDRYYGGEGPSSTSFAVGGGLPFASDWPRAYWLVGAAASVCLLAGVATRAACLSLYVVLLLSWRQNRFAAFGDDICRLLLFYSSFAELSPRAGGAASDPLVPAWPFRLIQVHVAVVYAVAFLYKAFAGPTWLSGEALYWVLMNRSISSWPWPELLRSEALVALMTYGTLLLEASLPVLLWLPATAPYAVAAAIGLQLLMVFSFKTVFLFAAAFSPPLLLFLPAETIKAPGGRR